jgi:hypothetical protein
MILDWMVVVGSGIFNVMKRRVGLEMGDRRCPSWGAHFLHRALTKPLLLFWQYPTSTNEFLRKEVGSNEAVHGA